MPAYYSGGLLEFASAPHTEISAKLADQNARAAFPLAPEALFAWQNQLPYLQNAAKWLLDNIPGSNTWSFLLEYPIPRIGKRIDAVLLARDVIIVIETKTGDSSTSAARQVDDYALNLACFHEPSASAMIVPLVVANSHVKKRTDRTRFDHLIQSCEFARFDELGPKIREIVNTQSKGEQRDGAAWNEGQFKPIPPIIEAAVSLYSNMNVFEIGHSCAAREDLNRATNSLVSAVCSARHDRAKTICFVTGVPGAGKTLVGLNAVHEPAIHDDGSFLSGNGPLVKIIREALVRDVMKRKRITRIEASLLVQTFIQNVHRFADLFHQNDKVPDQRVVVFDEAQRAWDLIESRRAGRELSEPEMLLQIMDRRPDWAVIIALVGGGQEINRGEAGLAEWGRALANFPRWRIIASPEVLPPYANSGEFRLFENANSVPEQVVANTSLHLKVAVRSIRAQKISDWVNAVLDGRAEEAGEIANGISERPALTRELSAAKSWLHERRRGYTRAGLVGSAAANRLRADGLEPSFDFHRRFDWENWFLDGEEDVRCSSRLEVFATQFEIQGLELDFVGVCWNDDFTWDGERWVSNRFNSKRWRPLNLTTAAGQRKHQFRINGYRVLLTRARQGMVIYVPKASTSDETRLAADLNRTAEYLCRCGAQELCVV